MLCFGARPAPPRTRPSRGRAASAGRVHSEEGREAFTPGLLECDRRLNTENRCANHLRDFAQLLGGLYGCPWLSKLLNVRFGADSIPITHPIKFLIQFPLPVFESPEGSN